MLTTTALLTGSASVLVVAFCIKQWLKIRQYPPGPRYSLFGDLIAATGEESEKNVLTLRKYGDVASQFVLSSLAVYLNTYDSIKEAYVTLGEATAGRLPFKFPSENLSKAAGIVTSEGPIWVEHRRFALSSLRNFGLGRNRAQEIVQVELESIIADFQARNNQPFEPRLTLSRATSSCISRLVFGHRAGCEKEYERVYTMLRENVETIAPNNLIVLMFLSKLLPFISLPGTAVYRAFKRTRRNIDSIADYLRKKVEEHEEVFDPLKEDEDLIDAYLSERYKLSKESPSEPHTFTETQLLRVILELFIAGTETSATTVRWGIFLLAHHPEIQEKAQREIDEILQGRLPGLVDKMRLTYTNAVIMEIQRFASVTPIGGPPHRCLQDCHIKGYLIPKGSVMFANIFAVHRDESIWCDPYSFNPQNFLDTAGCIKNEHNLIPFNIGKRSCLGEGLAKQEIFIFLCGLLQRFTFEKTANFPKITESICTNVIRFPKDFKIIARLRDAN